MPKAPTTTEPRPKAVDVLTGIVDVVLTFRRTNGNVERHGEDRQHSVPAAEVLEPGRTYRN